MSDPTDIRWEVNLSVDDENYRMHYLDTGVPHAIHFVEDIQTVDLQTLGPKVRFHPQFAPKGANFNVASVDRTGEVWIRTYERGVEQETLACGTGATAAAISAAKNYGLKSPVRVHTKSLETLEIGFDFIGDRPTAVTMTGPAAFIYQGKVSLEQYR